jgi:hypothetical protein
MRGMFRIANLLLCCGVAETLVDRDNCCISCLKANCGKSLIFGGGG